MTGASGFSRPKQKGDASCRTVSITFVKYLEQMLAEAEVTPEPEVSSRQYNPRRFRTMDVADLFEDLRRQPVPQLAPGASVYRRPQMAEEGVPANAERV